MSRQNKVNPGMYTQRGRLTQDDAARELRKQSALGTQHTWQPVKKKAMPRVAPADDAARGTETSADEPAQEETSPPAETRPQARATKHRTATKAAGRARAAKPAGTGKVAKVAKPAKAKAVKAAKAARPAAKRAATKPARKAVRARSAGPTSRSTTKRRTS